MYLTKTSPDFYKNASTWLRRHFIAASLMILFASIGPRLFLTWRADPSNLVASNDDAATYLSPAQNLLAHKAFLNWRGKPEVSRTPGYPAFLAAVMFVVGQDLRAVLVIQTLILSLQVVVLYWLARHILAPVTAFAAGLLAAFSPWGAAFAGFPLTEGLYLFLLALIFLAMRITADTANRTHAVAGAALTGLLTAAAVLVRPITPLVLLIGASFFMLYGPKRQGVWLLLMVMIILAVTPLFLWKARNQRVSQFNGLSDVSSICPFQLLAVRVSARISNQDKFILSRKVQLEESSWNLPVQQHDQERWRRAMAVFRAYPVWTVYYFFWSAAEHAVHPSPNILSSAKLNFQGDYWTLGILWGGLLMLAYLGWRYQPDTDFDGGTTDRRWLLGISVVCILLTLSSGVCFGAGARLRMSLELIVPLLAAVGLSRLVVKGRHASIKRVAHNVI